MLQVIVAGNLGADAEVRGEQGREFTTFRVAHTDRWTGQDGVSHENTVWVDCTLNGRPNVVPYLRKGTQVVVIGTASLRVYSSPRDRCMKAGLQVSVRTVELLGGVSDAVPARLYDTEGQLHVVEKLYHTNVAYTPLMSQRGARFFTDKDGFVVPTDVQPEAQNVRPIERQPSDSQPSVAQIVADGDADSADVFDPDSHGDGVPFI